jgi:hypothetical protein
MQSTLTARQADPHDMFVIEPDVVLAARGDAPDARAREPDLRALVSEISAGVAAHATAPKVDTSFRSVATEKRRGKWAARFIVAFLFALVSAVGAGAWHRYGDEAQAYVAEAASLLGVSSLQATSAPASTPAVAEATPDQAAPPAEATTQPADTTVASAPATPATPDQTQLIQSLSQDLATMGRQVEALKASIAELKAGQEQLSRDAKAAEAKASEAKALEQSMRAKVSALPSHPPVKKPKPYVPPVQASAAPLQPPPGAPGSAPVQIAPPPPASVAPQDNVPRPPMPVRTPLMIE